MLKEKAYVLGRVNALLDLLLGVAAFFIAYALRDWLFSPYLFPNLFRPTRIADHLLLLALLPPLAVAALALNGHYHSRRLQRPVQVLGRTLLAVAEATVATLVLFFFLKKEDASRGQLLVMPAVQTLLIGLHAVAVQRALMYYRNRGKNFRRVLLVGSGEPLRQFISILKKHPFWGFHIKGVITDDPAEEKDQGQRYGYPVVGHLDDTLAFLWDRHIDEVIFSPARAAHAALAPVLEGCEEMGIRTHLALNAFGHRISRPLLARFEDIPVVTYSPVRPIGTSLLLKAVVDRVGAFCLLVLLSPLFALIALLIRLTSSRGDPIFYGQKRSGLNGKPFTCWKFRSMRVGAHDEMDKLREQNEMTGPVFKMKQDPRITAVGRILRKTSLDELPQIFNVLRGDMSIVGPRPPIPEEVLKYDRWQRRRLSMKPGITCLWQVSGRNKLPFETWMRLDLEYIDNWSLLLDFKIMLRTVFVVLTGDGAM